MKVFYSWQSDLPNNTNRSLIERALTAAAEGIASDESIEVEPVVDRDTFGVPGAPNIAQAILRKIDQCDAFVADVSIIGSAGDRPTPNPNVLVELGYALSRLGWEQLILVQNTAYGSPEELPFDLRMARIVTYLVNQEDQLKAPARKHLESVFNTALRTIIQWRQDNPIDEPSGAEGDVVDRVAAALADQEHPATLARLVEDLRNRVVGELEAEDLLDAEALWIANCISDGSPVSSLACFRYCQRFERQVLGRARANFALLGGALSSGWTDRFPIPILRSL